LVDEYSSGTVLVNWFCWMDMVIKKALHLWLLIIIIRLLYWSTI